MQSSQQRMSSLEVDAQKESESNRVHQRQNPKSIASEARFAIKKKETEFDEHISIRKGENRSRRITNQCILLWIEL